MATSKQLQARKKAGRNTPAPRNWSRKRKNTRLGTKGLALGFYGCDVLDTVIVVGTTERVFNRPANAEVRCPCGGHHLVGSFLWRKPTRVERREVGEGVNKVEVWL